MSVLAETAQHVLVAGRASYPAVGLSDDELLEAFEAAFAPARATSVDPVATAVRCPADLFLAIAAHAGDPEALRVLDHLLADVKPALRGVVLDHDIDELAQQLRVRLVIGTGGRAAALASYTGKGPLRAWLRVALLRSGLDHRRRPTDAILDETAWLAIPADSTDPALALLRRSAGPTVRAAIEQAMTRLDARDRLVLRQHLLDGLAPPELAALHGVHRVTAFRWIATIRQRLLADVRAALQIQLGVDSSALESLMRGLRDSVAPTIERILIAESESA